MRAKLEPESPPGRTDPAGARPAEGTTESAADCTSGWTASHHRIGKGSEDCGTSEVAVAVSLLCCFFSPAPATMIPQAAMESCSRRAEPKMEKKEPSTWAHCACFLRCFLQLPPHLGAPHCLLKSMSGWENRSPFTDLAGCSSTVMWQKDAVSLCSNSQYYSVHNCSYINIVYIYIT